MKFSRGNRGFSNRGFDRSERPQLHDAVCESCGKNCQVPFRPNGSKPVYCSECFENNGGGNRSRNNDNVSVYRNPKFETRNRFESNDRFEKRMFDAVCDECGNDCQVPFKPTAGKPVLCSLCFKGESKGKGSNNNEQIDAKLIEIDKKLDQILKILKPEIVSESQKSETTKEILEQIGDAIGTKKISKKRKKAE